MNDPVVGGGRGSDYAELGVGEDAGVDLLDLDGDLAWVAAADGEDEPRVGEEGCDWDAAVG